MISRIGGFFLLCLLCVKPPGLHAQEGRATWSAAAGLTVTSVRSRTTTFTGGRLLLHPRPRFFFGGGGWVLNGDQALEGAGSDTGLQLRMAYGGAVVGGTVAPVGPLAVTGSVLMGAGNARILVRAVGAEIAADNFLVLEPTLSLQATPREPFVVQGTVGYRWVTGVEDISGVTAPQLRGLGVTLAVGIHPR